MNAAMSDPRTWSVGQLQQHQQMYPQPHQSQQLHPAELFVGNLPPTVTKSDLARELGRYGPLAYATLVYAPGGGFRGFAYVRFARPEAAADLLAGPPPMLEGRQLRVEWRRRGGPAAIESAAAGNSQPQDLPQSQPHPVMQHEMQLQLPPPPPTYQQQQQRHYRHQPYSNLQLPLWLHARLVEDTERLVDCLLAELRLCNRLAAAAPTAREADAFREQARGLEARIRSQSAELVDLTLAGRALPPQRLPLQQQPQLPPPPACCK